MTKPYYISRILKKKEKQMLKKALAIMATLAILVSCSMGSTGIEQVQEMTSETASVNPMVQLVQATSYVHSKYGMSSCSRTFKVKVKDIAYDKQVIIHHRVHNDGWSDLPMEYVKDTDDGYEVWELVFNPPQLDVWEDQFCVKYTAGGTTYWDNNNSGDYYLGLNGGVLLGAGTNVHTYSGYAQSNYDGSKSFWGNIDLRNIAYDKSVNIVYTTDGWATTNVAAAGYQTWYSYGYSGMHYSPNEYGIERWSVNIDLPADATGIEYVVSYDVAGQTFWDNNFGDNYYAAIR
jgi:hypothetical protein